MPAGSAASDVTVLVDYAHTDDALANVLSALRPLTNGRLIALFGCGGDRDRGKRRAWPACVLNTRTRSSSPATIPAPKIRRRSSETSSAGFTSDELSRVLIEPDRKEAILKAVKAARPGDVVLVAGKGHENYQIVGQKKLPFDDAVIAGDVLTRMRGAA